MCSENAATEHASPLAVVTHTGVYRRHVSTRQSNNPQVRHTQVLKIQHLRNSLMEMVSQLFKAIDNPTVHYILLTYSMEQSPS
jgi:hypothetical protein